MYKFRFCNLKKNILFFLISAALLIGLVFVVGCARGINTVRTTYNTQEKCEGIPVYSGYKLEQSTIISRHNLRSPVNTKTSNMPKLTNYEWTKWTSKDGELTNKGGSQEALMGQYFRQYYEEENFLPRNWVPKDDEVLFYSNSIQRTIATAKYFSAGLIPNCNIDVVYKGKIGDKDPVFSALLPKDNPQLKSQIEKEANEYNNHSSIQDNVDELSDNFNLLENLIDFKASQYAKENNIEKINEGDSYMKLEKNSEPTLMGPIHLANEIVDPLKLQYYEEEDDKKAAFGKEFSYEDWKKIAHISDEYFLNVYSPHTISTQVMHQMLLELNKDINNKNRKITFLSGHDTTIIPTLHALDVEDYELPNAISTQAPIGSKIVINKYKKWDKKEFFKVFLVYETVDQMRHRDVLSFDKPPMAYELDFKGIDKNIDGFINFDDFQNRLNYAISEYDKF